MDWNVIRDLIGSSEMIIAFTGAGISTNSGIPDFRGEGGLYSFVKEKYRLPYGEAIFDINYFDRNPRPFFDLSKDLIAGHSEPTRCHRTLSLLEEQGKITKVITQNIDRLHQRAGTKSLLECHGTYDTARCRSCGRTYVFDEYRSSLSKGEIPYCHCGGVIKPDVVFFGETLPEEFNHFWENPPDGDLLLILGTSLNVRPAADLALKLAGRMTSVIINNDETDYDSCLDLVCHEDLDLFAEKIVIG